MDDTTLKIAIAAFIHDIGHFVEARAPGGAGPDRDDRAEGVAAFLAGMGDHLPKCLSDPNWGEGGGLMDLTVKSTRPETPGQWIIAMASRISKGLGGDLPSPDSRGKPGAEDRGKPMLLPLFEQLMAKSGDAFDAPGRFSYCYPPKPISPETIFPVQRDAVSPGSLTDASEEYGALYRAFRDGVKKLNHQDVSMEMWFEHFESLMMIHASSIPAGGAEDGIPDATLYDHCKAASALAAALHMYHAASDTLDPESIQKYNEKKFLIVSGSFQGIQDFIFGGFGDSKKYRSKLLRGRSFAVSLLSELAGDMLCGEIGLPAASIIINAAGKFAILAPNTKQARECVKKVEDEINNWLVKDSHGETVVGLSLQAASPSDFVSGAFADQWERINLAREEKKYSSIDLHRHGGVVEGYLHRFDIDLKRAICPLCHKRPSEPGVEKTRYISEVISACAPCRDHVFLGANLVKQNRMAILTPGSRVEDKEKRLFNPIFGKYQIAFVETFSEAMAEKGNLLKYWNLNFHAGETASPNMTAKFINGHVPVYGPGDAEDERLLKGKKGKKREELIAELKKAVGDPKTLGHIARCALNFKREDRGLMGVDTLGVLKADVDNLGLLMACGLKPGKITLPRLTTLSRQLHYYFTVHLPYFLQNNESYRNVYTVFAGGDDLFLIGPWNRVIDLVMELRDTFSQYVCGNEKIHFSAGISFHKSHTPVDAMAEKAEKELKKSKTESEEKNRLTLFSETVHWDRVEDYSKIKRSLEEWMDQKTINKAMLFRLIGILPMKKTRSRSETGLKLIIYVSCSISVIQNSALVFW